MKTATVTWITYENYGTDLQAYALQQILKKLGHENDILSDQCHVNFRNEKHNLFYYLKYIYIYITGEFDRNHKYYLKFRERYLSINYSFNELKDSDSYDIFIAGSDQIWSPILNFDPYYYLGFTSKKKISYAASTGTGICTEEYKRNIKQYLDGFSDISVREESGMKMLANITSKSVSTVLDPTLLLSRFEWEKIVTPISIGSYLLCYFLSYNDKYATFLRRYANEHNLKLVIFATNSRYKKIADIYLYGGPVEFVSYIKNASIIFTDSFHATIFSIIFEKKFFTFKRFKDGDKNNQNDRIYNLFNILGIENHFIGEEELVLAEYTIPNWKMVNEKLQTAIEKSLSFLKNALDN